MRKLEATQKTLDETMIISGGGTKSFSVIGKAHSNRRNGESIILARLLITLPLPHIPRIS